MQAPAATAHGDALSPSCGHFRVARRSLRLLPSRIKRCAAQGDPATTAEDNGIDAVEEEVVKPVEIDIRGVASQADITQFAKKAAGTFAPRASGAVQNPAYKGSLLYNVFGWQAWASMVAGGLLSFNIIFPSDEPSIARLIGMWSVWMFTIPSLRARECTSNEKDALNILFLLIPLINVTIPIVWKSFALVYSLDVATMAAVYFWKLRADPQEAD